MNFRYNDFSFIQHFYVRFIYLPHQGGLHGLTKSSRHCSLVSSTRTNVSYNHSTTKQEWCTQDFILPWGMTTRLTRSRPLFKRSGSMSNASKNASKLVTYTIAAAATGGSTPWPTRRWGRPTFVAGLWYNDQIYTF